MSERLIDSVCPQCERIGTTVRVVKNEDGFTKLSRLCKECGGEWTNTFDADWLAVAKIRRLEAEVERLRAENDEKQALIDAASQCRNDLQAHIDKTYALLKDSNVVAVNLLRGVIALPSADQIRHIYQQTPEAKP